MNMAVVGLVSAVLLLLSARPTSAFTSFGPSRNTCQRQVESNFMGRRMSFGVMPSRRRQTRGRSGSSTSLNMFLGQDSGIFGVGAPEIAVVLLVGYFILGPQDLYKLVKEIGKVFNTLKIASTDITKNFEESMESTIEIDELRKAQRELNDAFSFRRSINVDEDDDPFTNKKAEGEVTAAGVVAGSSGDTSTTKKKKRKRRIKKKKVEPVAEDVVESSGKVEDLDMADAFNSKEELEKWEVEVTKAQQQNNEEATAAAETKQWFESVGMETDGEDPYFPKAESSEASAQEQSRFASQMSDDWNAKIMANEDKLSPLAQIMERLAILEEEKNAADQRLEEEFRMKAELEEKFYRDKRKLLEEAAAEVQTDAYVGMSASEKKVEEN